MSDTDFVDFANYCGINSSDISEPKPKKEKKIKKKRTPEECTLYKINGKSVVYNNETMEYYRVARQRKMDPLLFQEMDDNTAFKYDKWWDPYSPTIYGKDPYGPLYFHPDNLIRFFFVNRLVNLYVSKVEDDGEQTVYYDDGVGAGENFEIVSRGCYPERYLFRIPITNCYLTKDHTENLITMGPKLTDKDVEEIDKMAAKCGDSYKKEYGRSRPSLVLMKQYYDRAISKAPSMNIDMSTYTDEQKKVIYTTENKKAVDLLRTMRG